MIHVALFTPNNEGIINNLNRFLGHNITIVGDNEQIANLTLNEPNIKLNKSYKNVYIGYAYNATLEVLFNNNGYKKRLNSLNLNVNTLGGYFLALEPYFYSHKVPSNNTKQVVCLANNYSYNKALKVMQTNACYFNIYSLLVNLSTLK